MVPATLHQLKVFETVARHGSFTRAAEELSITQPTVSSQVKQLTKAVGLPLFEQIGKSLYLTDAGKELLSTCQDIFERLDNFQMAIAIIRIFLQKISEKFYLFPYFLRFYQLPK